MNEWCIQVPNTHLNTPVTSTNDQSHACCSFLWAFPLSAARFSPSGLWLAPTVNTSALCSVLHVSPSSCWAPGQTHSTVIAFQTRKNSPRLVDKLVAGQAAPNICRPCVPHRVDFLSFRQHGRHFLTVLYCMYTIYTCVCNIVCVGDLIFYDHQQHFRIVLSTEQEMKKIVISNVQRWSEDTNSL